MRAGDVFRLTQGADRHAKVIISDLLNFPSRVLFVGMTSYDAREDHSCMLMQGEHSTCVIPRTCITYARGNAKASNADLDRMLQAKLIQLYEPIAPEIL